MFGKLGTSRPHEAPNHVAATHIHLLVADVVAVTVALFLRDAYSRLGSEMVKGAPDPDAEGSRGDSDALRWAL